MQNSISIYPVKISCVDDMRKVCERIGTDPSALGYLAPKSNVLHIYAERVDYRAANFIKQEMLSRGGDTAVAKHVIDGRTDYSDILIMGTARQLMNLTEKMKAMNIWGIGELRVKLAEILRNINAANWELVSPNGNKIILGRKTKLMAILNLTPDSFFAGSRTNEREIVERAGRFLNEGAYILDVGAESTRPGASPVPEKEEAERLVPALKILRREFPDAIISVDTYKAGIAKISADCGADIINDISGAAFDSEMARTIGELEIPYVLSHIKGTPKDMADSEPYENIIGELNAYFSDKLRILSEAGVKSENVIIDPGLGFGKSAEDNFAVLRNVESLSVFGRPLMLGHSRKRFTRNDSIAGTLAVTAAMTGRASLLRVHDVAENMRALEIANAIR